jgi:hypothetical protein
MKRAATRLDFAGNQGSDDHTPNWPHLPTCHGGSKICEADFQGSAQNVQKILLDEIHALGCL